MLYDIIIIGSGPAGLTAAIFSTRREMKTLVIGKELGGQVVWASEIENYPGFKSISNFEFIERLHDQALSFGAEIKTAEVVRLEKLADETFKVYAGKEEFLAKTVVLTIGLSPRRLAVAGEIELSGHGVSYCANCDGPLYKGKIVAVIGGGNSAFDSAEMLSKIADQVYLIHRNQNFKAFESLITEVKERKNITILADTVVKEIVGDSKVEKIVYETIDGKTNEVSVDGVFIEIGRIAHTDLVADLVDRDDRLQIVVNNLMETKTSGLFAAGDVTDKSEYKQITVAVGQATTAALSAYKYLQTRNQIKKSTTAY
ncbi:MAG: FAD-dependent oxidoreductase [Patescibacteria group bacterium]|nr:FAD-dependent oxidoreductase [Patescibacteria group bacterium]